MGDPGAGCDGAAARVAAGDVGLFDRVPSETTAGDRRSLLAVQAAVADLLGGYRYLEIGSHLGGTLQPHLLDRRCEGLVSIDRRPEVQPDARGTRWAYPGNSTERMLDGLTAAGYPLDRLTCIDGDSTSVTAESLPLKPDVCFVDGEHTDAAAVRDMRLCASAVDGDGVVVFHDAAVVYNALHEIIADLECRGVAHHAYALPDSVFVIELGDRPIHRHPALQRWLVDNHVAYLAGLRQNDHYRVFASRPVVRRARAVTSLVAGRANAWLRPSSLRRG